MMRIAAFLITATTPVAFVNVTSATCVAGAAILWIVARLLLTFMGKT